MRHKADREVNDKLITKVEAGKTKEIKSRKVRSSLHSMPHMYTQDHSKYKHVHCKVLYKQLLN